MKIDLNVYVHLNSSLEERLNNIDKKLNKLVHLEIKEMQELDELKADVEAQGTVVDSAITLINGLAEQIANLKPDAAAIAELAAKVKGQSDALAAAVEANTTA